MNCLRLFSQGVQTGELRLCRPLDELCVTGYTFNHYHYWR